MASFLFVALCVVAFQDPGAVDSGRLIPIKGASTLFSSLNGVDMPAFAVISQNFTDDGINFQAYGGDDFTISDCGWEITEIVANGNYSSGTGPAASVNVYFLPKNGNLPTSTDLSSIAVWFGEEMPYTELDGVGGGDFQIALPNVILPAGDYWVVVQANMAFLSGGQWNWTESSLTPNSGTTNGDESVWFQTDAIIQDPENNVTTCVDAWGQRVTDCNLTRFPDSSPPADRDLAFSISGSVLTPGVLFSSTSFSTMEDGVAETVDVVLAAPPSSGATVTLAFSSDDLTEGTVSGNMNFTHANWDVPQTLTVTPGASGDGVDGDVAYTISTAVSSDVVAGCYDGVVAGDLSVTNQDADMPGSITVDPSSGISISEDGTTTATVTFTLSHAPTDPVTVDLTNNNSGEVSLSKAQLSFSDMVLSDTVILTGVADDVVEATQMFSITTEAAVSADPAFAGVESDDISGQVIDNNTAEVIVLPSANPLSVSETGTTATVAFSLSAQPTASVNFTISVDDATEGAVLPTSLTFDDGNWDIAQQVTLTGLDDDAVDGTISFNLTVGNTTSADPFWSGIVVADIAAENNDDGDAVGVSVNVGGGVTTDEGGTVDSFAVALDSFPTASVSIDFRSGDATEGLLGLSAAGPFSETVTLTIQAANWSMPHDVFVQGQDDTARSDGDVVYTVFSENVSSGDPLYDGISDGAVIDISVTNEDDGLDIEGISVSPSSLSLAEDAAPGSLQVTLDSEPLADVTIPIAGEMPDEATVSPASLTFTAANWSTPQTVTITPLTDEIIDGDQSFDIVLGPASGGNYDGQSASVAMVVEDVDFCEPTTIIIQIGEPIVVLGTPTCTVDLYNDAAAGGGFLGTFTIGAGGSVNTGVIAQEDGVYQTTIAGTVIVLNPTPAYTVPTLQTMGLIVFILGLMVAALYLRRRSSTVTR